MFLDYVNSSKKSRSATISRGSQQIRRPQVILLLGDFSEEEYSCLKRSIQSHFSVTDGIFWVNVFPSNMRLKEVDFFKVWKQEMEDYCNRIEWLKKVQSGTIMDFMDRLAGEFFNAISGLYFEESGIMLSLVLKPDQAQTICLQELAQILKKSLQVHFTNVFFDVYMVTDQSAYMNDKELREATVYRTFSIVENLIKQNTVQLGYVLSNCDSTEHVLGMQEAIEEQYTSIALLITLKNLIPDNTSHNYRDDDFGRAVVDVAEARGIEPGVLSSAGHINLHIDEEYNILVVYRAVWEHFEEHKDEDIIESLIKDMGISKNQIRMYFQPGISNTVLSVDDFETIVRNRGILPQSINTMQNGKAIERIFSTNLDLYYDLNLKAHDLEQKLDDWMDSIKLKASRLPDDISCADTLLLFHRLEEIVEDLINDTDAELQQRRIRMEKWKGLNAAQRKGSGQGNNPLYELANDYLRNKRELDTIESQAGLYQLLLKKVVAVKGGYQKIIKLAEDNVANLDKMLKERFADITKREEGVAKLQFTNTEAYYNGLANEMIQKNDMRAYRELSRRIRQKVDRGEINEEEIYENVAEFCERYIFADERFHMTFLSELENRLIGYEEEGGLSITTSTDVSNFLLTTIVGAKHYLFRDIYGGFQSHEEMCLFLNNDSIFTGKKDFNAVLANLIADQKMKLFCDDSCNSLDVLFLAGNLYAHNIYKWKSYQESYEKVMENEKNGDQL